MNKGEMKKVFCVSYGGGHINIIKQIYYELQNRKNICTNILALTMADSILNRDNIPHTTISEYLDIFDYKDSILKYGYECVENEDIAKDIKYVDSIVYHGIGYCDLVKEVGEERAKVLFAENGRKVFMPVRSMRTILKKENPDVLLITNSPRMETAAGIAANELNIPVVRVNDLPYMDKKPAYRAKVCVMNEWAKKDIIDKNLVESEDIIITGQPVFEDDLKLVTKEIEKYEVSIKKNYDNVILYLGQGYIKEAIGIVDTLVNIAKENQNWLIIVRPHPNDFHDYEADYGRMDNCIFTKEGDLKYMLKISDVAVTITSTSGLQAVLLGTPLIQMQVLENGYFDIPGAIASVDSTIGLKETILKVIDNKANNCNSMLDAIKKYGNKPNASANIVDVIINQFENKGK